MNYITNFIVRSKFASVELRSDKRIFCNFFFLIYLILYFLIKYRGDTTLNYFCYPINSHKTSFLRSPNRSKSAQVLIRTQKFKLAIVIRTPLKTLNLPSLQLVTTQFIVFLCKKTQRRVNFFESNIFIFKSFNLSLLYNYNLIKILVGSRYSKYISLTSNLDRSFKKKIKIILYMRFKKLNLITLTSFIRFVYLFFSKKLPIYVVDCNKRSMYNSPMFDDSLD
jgi:hypothetical protein